MFIYLHTMHLNINSTGVGVAVKKLKRSPNKKIDDVDLRDI